LLAKGDTKAALNQFNAVTQNKKSAQFAQATYRAGECAMQSGDFAEAVKRFAVFRDQGPYQNLPGLTDRAMLRLGHALEKQKQWEPSRQAHEQVVNRFPQSPWVYDARYGIAWAHQNQNQWDQAIAHYTQVANGIATELGARAQLNVGVCKLAQKKYAEATTALLAVPSTYDYPEINAQALVEAARACAENKQKDEAIKLLETVLRDYPGTDAVEAAKKHLAELRKG
jgi:TolA-binding protein